MDLHLHRVHFLVVFFDPERRYPFQAWGTLQRGRQKHGVGKICDYRQISRKRYEIGPYLLWNVNRKS